MSAEKVTVRQFKPITETPDAAAQGETMGADAVSKGGVRQVLALSEMALSVDDQYLGEVDNPRYLEKEDMFEYDPGHGLLVDGQKETILLADDDFIKLPHDVGYVTVERLFQSKAGQYSDQEFQRRLYHIVENIEGRIDKVVFLAKAAGVDFTDQDKARAVRETANTHEQFSPEELIDANLTEFEDKLKRTMTQSERQQKGLETIVQDLKQTGVLDPDPKKSKAGIVNFFYLYCRLKGIDTSDMSAIYGEGFENFWFLDELMEEYKTYPDERFSDALLAACSQQQHENEA